MKTAGYIFLALLLAVLLYVSVERFTVTVTGADAATPPMMMGGPMSMQGPMGGPMPTSAMSTTSTFAAPVDLMSKPPESLAPPLPPSLQPVLPTPPTTEAPPEATSRLDELVKQEQAASAELYTAIVNARGAQEQFNQTRSNDAVEVLNNARRMVDVADQKLLGIQNELAALRR